MSTSYPQPARQCTYGYDGHLDLFTIVRIFVTHGKVVVPTNEFDVYRMAAAMLIILAAYRIPQLRSLIRRDVASLGRHLKLKLERWMLVPGQDVSPGVQHSLRLISIADDLIRNGIENSAFR